MKRFLLCLVVLSIVPMLNAADWPQWRGLHGDSKSPETGILKQWPKGGPKVAWQINTIGTGYSAPVIAGEQLFIAGARNGKAELIALNVKTGKEQWKLPFAKPYGFKGNNWGGGPRASLCVDGDRVYALSGDGTLVCANVKTGKENWHINYVKDFDGEVDPEGGAPKIYAFGFSAAPFIDEDHVICQTGGRKGCLTALNKKTGKAV